MYLSIFTVSKIICRSKRVDESLFESIIGPPLAGLRKSPGLWKNRIRESGRRLVTRYIPDLPRMALEMTLTWDPTWKSVPSLPRVKVKVRRKLSAADQKRLRKVSAFHCIEDELNAWFRLAHTSVSGISDWVCLSWSTDFSVSGNSVLSFWTQCEDGTSPLV